MHPIHRSDASTKESILCVIPEVFGNKVIDKGIDAAIEGGEAEGRDVQGIDVALAPVFNQEIVHHKQKVTRSETNQVHGQDCDNKLNGSLPPLL